MHIAFLIKHKAIPRSHPSWAGMFEKKTKKGVR